MKNSEFLVDIPICTYNQEKFIAQTIQGILNQRTNFKYRLFIGEDCSSDGTKDVIKKYLALHPDIIFAFFHERNLGAHENSKILFKACNSKYIALCDGDDYWVNNDKLQKQVEFLETNPDYVACSTNAFEDDGSGLRAMVNKKNILTFEDFAYGNPIYTSSVLCKNIITLPSWFAECKMGDWIIWLLLSQNGPVYNFEEPMTVYRMHNNGIWIGKGKESNLKDMIAAYNILIENLPIENRARLIRGAKQHYNQLLSILCEKKSKEIFYWTNRAFWFSYNIKSLGYLVRYFRNVLFSSSVLHPSVEQER